METPRDNLITDAVMWKFKPNIALPMVLDFAGNAISFFYESIINTTFIDFNFVISWHFIQSTE